jgi:aldose 1-epimerase
MLRASLLRLAPFSACSRHKRLTLLTMNRLRPVGLIFLAALPVFGQYSTRIEGDVVRLQDRARQTVVSVMPSRGNNAFEMKVNGKDVLRFPFASADEFKNRGSMSGVPFLAPWANRLDETAFYANGKKYTFNMELGNVRGPNPMHGLLQTAPWEVVEARADSNSAWVTSRLDFYRQPDWMAQFPFAHIIEMTYRLKDGVLEVAVKLNNLSAAPMPVAIGFHPYFQVNDAPRDEWTFGIGARTHWLAKANIPTGETEPIEKLLPAPQGGSLKSVRLDDGFGDLIRDASGKATMWVQGKSERVEVLFGPKYTTAVVWFPAGPNMNFICFEPMAGITDSLNLAQKGLYRDLQYLAPGQTWQESFWIRPLGF